MRRYGSRLQKFARTLTFQTFCAAGKLRRPRCPRQTSLRLPRRGSGLLHKHRRPEVFSLLLRTASSFCVGKSLLERKREPGSRRRGSRPAGIHCIGCRFGVEFVHGFVCKCRHADAVQLDARPLTRNELEATILHVIPISLELLRPSCVFDAVTGIPGEQAERERAEREAAKHHPEPRPTRRLLSSLRACIPSGGSLFLVSLWFHVGRKVWCSVLRPRSQDREDAT